MMLLTDPSEKSGLRVLEERYVAGVGFANRAGGTGRPDAACWAILALRAAGSESAVVEKARQALVEAQHEDGRVCLSPQHPEVCWPTPLAVLAWHGAAGFEEPRTKAIRFLLDFEQAGVLDDPQKSEGHDETIPGWPWVVRTHPWVEPTAYALLALRLCGRADHRRAQDAVRLLLNRQLSAGGWNCGSTITFGQEMLPMPENTGPSLEALAGLAPQADVDRSIRYLQAQLAHLSTPLSLAWAILGLHAWRQGLDRPREQIRGVLARQKEYGPYDTVSLSLLLLAWHCEAGLMRFLEND